MHSLLLHVAAAVSDTIGLPPEQRLRGNSCPSDSAYCPSSFPESEGLEFGFWAVLGEMVPFAFTFI